MVGMVPLALDTNEIMDIFPTSGHEEIETEMSSLEKKQQKCQIIRHHIVRKSLNHTRKPRIEV